VPFEKLVEELSPERDLGRSPLFQVEFTMQNFQVEDLTLAGLREITGLEAGSHQAKNELVIACWEFGNRIHGAIQYPADLFDKTTIRRIPHHLTELLQSAIASPEESWNQLSLLNEIERRQLLVNWNDTRQPVEFKCVHELLEVHARRTPDAVAVICEDRHLSYSELNVRATALVRYLRNLGVGAETRIGLCMQRSVEAMVGLLGILKAGAVLVPVEPAVSRARLLYIMDDSRPSLMLSDRNTLEILPAQSVPIVCLDNLDLSFLQPEDILPDVGPENLAYIIYTSGSTENPKGVAVTHAGVCNLALAQMRIAGIHAQDRCLQYNSFASDAAVAEWATALAAGATLVMAPQKVIINPQELAEFIRQYVHVMSISPLLLARLPEQLLQQVHTIFAGGEALPATVAQRWIPGRQLFSAYGPTGHVMAATISGPMSDTTATLGRPIANTETYVLDTDGNPVPIGIPGELYIGGVGLARGYFAQPALTAEHFVPNWFSTQAGERLYRTGDRVRWLSEGTLEFLGCLDDRVKIRGYRVEPAEIEKVLNRHEWVERSVVLSLHDNSMQPRLRAFVVCRKLPQLPATPEAIKTELMRYLQEILPSHMLPASITLLEQMPATLSGKIDRNALSKIEREADLNLYTMEPRDSTEAFLKVVWQEILDRNDISLQDDFFLCGGHSLKAVRLFARLREAYGEAITIQSIFAHTTIEKMAAFLRQEVASVSSTIVVPLLQRGSRLPFFCVHPAGGLVQCYAELSRHMHQEQPFYAIQSQGWSTGERPLTTIEEMASLYIDRIRAIQPAGPYRIGGWSMGAVVAYEMAQQLTRAGEDVGLLALLDGGPEIAPPAPQTEDGAFEREYILTTAQDIGLDPDALVQLSLEEQIAQHWEYSRRTGHVPLDITLEQYRRLLEIYGTNIQATRRYRPCTYRGPATLVVADATDRTRFIEHIRSLITGPFHHCAISVSHSELLQMPAVEQVAAVLEAKLADGMPFEYGQLSGAHFN
jgi:amino acid adenylation domain-containing protein